MGRKLFLSGLLLPSINLGNGAVIFKVLLVKSQVRTGAVLLLFLQGYMWKRTRKLLEEF